MGLPYLSMRPFTDDEWDTLPHIILTSEIDWDPTTLARELDIDDEWFDALTDEIDYPLKGIFNLQGEYKKRTILFHDSAKHVPVHNAYSVNVNASGKTDYKYLCPKFGWMSVTLSERRSNIQLNMFGSRERDFKETL
jgi:hypothetical protein